MKGLDLYAGVGSYSLAMQRAGIEVVCAAESDAWRRDVYMARCQNDDTLIADTVADAMGVEADLWCACVGVAELERLVREHCNDGPKWLLLESVREPFGGIQDALASRKYAFTQWDACGRRFILAGPDVLALDVPDELMRGTLQRPSAQNIDHVEESLGLGAGYTGCCGATLQQRVSALGATSNVRHLEYVLRRLVQA